MQKLLWNANKIDINIILVGLGAVAFSSDNKMQYKPQYLYGSRSLPEWFRVPQLPIILYLLILEYKFENLSARCDIPL